MEGQSGLSELSVILWVSASLVPRPRPAFRRLLIATESWAGPGNEARCLLFRGVR